MAICPSCQSQIEIGSEFFGGLFACDVCKATFFVGFDGTPEQGNSVQEPAVPPPPIAVPPEYTPEAPAEYVPENPLDYSLQPPVEEPYYQMPESEPTPLMPVAPAPVFEPLKEVVDFANDESATGLFQYSVTIEGLDTAENLQSFKDVLSDSKLGLDYAAIKKQIRNGSVKLESLNPTQAAIIAFRIRPLPLEMKWDQKIL